MESEEKSGRYGATSENQYLPPTPVTQQGQVNKVSGGDPGIDHDRGDLRLISAIKWEL